MASSKSLISTALAGLALCVATSAQSGSGPVQALNAQKFEGGITKVRAQQVVDENGQFHWDYTVLGRDNARANGGSSSLATPGQRKALVNSFNNTITNGFFSVGTTGTEWMDWALKDSGNTGFVGAFAFAYASNARGLSEPGGTGATLGVSFFAGTTGFCSRGTRAQTGGGQDAIFGFAGLPGATGSQISPGFSVTATVDGSNVFCLPDGKIGWSYVFLEPPMGTNQNLTGPLLTDLTSNTCWNDAFDLWSTPDPIASCAGVFFFGGCNSPTTFAVPNPCAGFWIKLYEEQSSPGFSAIFNSTTTPNPIRYAEIQSANLASNWVTGITLAPNPAGAEVAGLIRFGLPGTIIPGNGIGLSFLVNGSRLKLAGSATNVVVSGPGNPKISSIAWPKDLIFLGSVWNTQGFAVLLSPVRLQALNGITISVGVQ